MKPFNLEAAKRGEPIVTRDGRKAKFVAYVPEVKDEFKVIVYVEGTMNVLSYCDDGMYYSNCECATDLFMYSPPMRSINGHEYPEPVLEPLKCGQEYWLADFSVETFTIKFRWNESHSDLTWLKRGLIHLTHEAAEAHARAIILAGGGEV